MTKTFSVPSSGALIVRALGKAIRERAVLSIKTHEHWDFEIEFDTAPPQAQGWYYGIGAAEAIAIGGSEPLDMRALVRQDLSTEPGDHGEYWLVHLWIKSAGKLHLPVSCRYSVEDDRLVVIPTPPLQFKPIKDWFVP